MKKYLTVLLLLLVFAGCAAFAESAPLSAEVYVSVSDDAGALVLACVPVTVTDLDADGLLTIHDALTAAHTAHHPDGAAGYLAEASEFGLSMVRLWGIENGGSFGYYLDDASVWSLLDEVNVGAHVKAYAFTDLAAWSDTYAFFSAHHVDAAPAAEITLTLSCAAYDDAWNPVTLPVEGAQLLLDGTPIGAVTDAQGMVRLQFTEPGSYVISARSQTQTLVPPVCIVTIGEGR